MKQYAAISTPESAVRPAAAGAFARRPGRSPLDRQSLRRGSVLVLVMTLLSILFVVGVAFLASMNFEADIIASERQRTGARRSVDATIDSLTDSLRDAVLSTGGELFGAAPPAESLAGFAELPGWHNLTAPLEPYWQPASSVPGGAPDRFVFSGGTDLLALQQRPFDGPKANVAPELNFEGFDDPRYPFAIDTAWRNGDRIRFVDQCVGGFREGQLCAVDEDCPNGTCSLRLNLQWCEGGPNEPYTCQNNNQCPGGACVGRMVLDADGDGIVDSVGLPARWLGLSPMQLADLSRSVNGSPDGEVYIALRIVSHGGMVNLNEAHPQLMQRLFNLPGWPEPGQAPDPDQFQNFIHRPTFEGGFLAYSPLIEEGILRNRGLIPPALVPPSRLHGNRFADNPQNPQNRPDLQADMARQLFHPLTTRTQDYESVLTRGEFRHRSWLYRPGEPFHANDPDAMPQAWPMRMEPFYSNFHTPNNQPIRHHYDRRHLVTTTSHDDLLARGGRVKVAQGREVELREAMLKANWSIHDPDSACITPLPFEYADYPRTIPNGPDCLCPTDPVNCDADFRKGRLLLSLPWLDEFFSPDNLSLDPTRTLEQRNRLIHDAFWMLVRNAAGGYWEDQDCAGTLIATCDGDTEFCPATQIDQALATELCEGVDSGLCCFDRVTKQPRRMARIARTAASLTANMIDYADFDDVPTRIAIRNFDFTGPRCFGGTNAGSSCPIGNECTGGYCVRPGEPIRLPRPLNQPPYLYVYGLEKQPYITEVVTHVPNENDPIDWWGVELFNPYDVDLSATGQYWFFFTDENGAVVNPPIQITDAIPPAGSGGPFTAFVSAAGSPATLPTGRIVRWTSPANDLNFLNGWTIHLVRSVLYDGELATFVVDQFEVQGGNVGVFGPPLNPPPAGPTAYSLQRYVSDDPNNRTSRWTATVPSVFPDDGDGSTGNLGHSLGGWNGPAPTALELRPVEIRFANTGSFTRPIDPINEPTRKDVAFPTTGSLLWLMRHANRGFSDRNLPDTAVGGGGTVTTRDLAFTTRLMDITRFPNANPVIGEDAPQSNEWEMIDNGRMPVFDRVKAKFLPPPDNRYSRAAAHHRPPRGPEPGNPNQEIGKPGDVSQLPWGQLVFDYFTALPLNNRGPYRAPDPTDPDAALYVAKEDSLPRIDLDGLRVHGRINLNAAPWTVLSGVPFTPLERIPPIYRAATRKALGFVRYNALDQLNPDNLDLLFADRDAVALGEDLAQAAVAYRDAREGVPIDHNNPNAPVAFTGHFGLRDIAGITLGRGMGRGWRDETPRYRRGTGFLTVGELANVRHDLAFVEVCPPGVTPPCLEQPIQGRNAFSTYRFDMGMVREYNPFNIGQPDPDPQDFISAIAGLAALSDWVTVRSHVHTLYGVIRGAEDFELARGSDNEVELKRADLDARSLHFRETVDRLPTLLGRPAPQRIGERQLGAYTETSGN